LNFLLLSAILKAQRYQNGGDIDMSPYAERSCNLLAAQGDTS
jgi:hypothetical protein